MTEQTEVAASRWDFSSHRSNFYLFRSEKVNRIFEKDNGFLTHFSEVLEELKRDVIIWALIEPDKLSQKVRKILEDPGNNILASVISLLEISLKYSLGKLNMEGIMPDEIPGYLREIFGILS